MVDKTQWIQFYNKKKYTIWILGCSLFFASVLSILHQTQSPEPLILKDTPIPMTETYIPAGHTLIPIKISNHESLNALLGPYGIVNLYADEILENSIKSKLIAKNVKIIRAPLDPNEFAVLIPNSDHSPVAQHHGSFTVTIQNMNHDPAKVISPNQKKKRIFYGD